MSRLRGYTPPLPCTIQSRRLGELSLITNMTLEIADELEEHVKKYPDSYSTHPYRHSLLVVQATCNERIAELQELLGFGEN